MYRVSFRVLILIFCITVSCCASFAQTEKTITIQMLDGRTGKLIASSDFLVRVDHQSTLHGNWVIPNEDGTGRMTLPKDTVLFTIQGTYDSSMQTYINCDSASEKENPTDRWYAAAEILTAGIVAPNSCEKPSAAAKIKPAAKPGVFVFFVRKLNWREEMKDYESH